MRASICTHSSLIFKIRHSALADFLFPFVKERPAGGTGAEVGHVLIAGEAVDRFLDDAIIPAKHRAVAGQEELGIVLANALERMNEVRNIGAVMGVNDTDATVLVDVVTAEKQVAHFEAQLPGGVARGMPNLELQAANCDDVALLENQVHFARRHGNVDSLSLDGSVGH